MKTLKLLAAVLVPAALIAAAGTASAAGPKKKPGKIFRALVKDGALTKADLKPLKPIVKELRGCHADVKSGAKPAGSCKLIRARLMQAHVRLLKKAAPRIPAHSSPSSRPRRATSHTVPVAMSRLTRRPMTARMRSRSGPSTWMRPKRRARSAGS